MLIVVVPNASGCFISGANDAEEPVGMANVAKTSDISD